MRAVYFLVLLFVGSAAWKMPWYAPSKNCMTHQKAGGALLLPDFHSLEELKSMMKFTYGNSDNPHVKLQYEWRGIIVTSELNPGIDENDFHNARKGGLMKRFKLLVASPYTVVNKNDLEIIELLSRRRDHIFGEGDVAFYDLAETMVQHISAFDRACMDSFELSEKGYLNTFNHVVAQTFMTTIFSERLADFVGDVHERSRLPELITGEFSEEQLQDLNNGPVDNYIDMVNNDWGQEQGKILKAKYGITRQTIWTSKLLADFLNDCQQYQSWVFQIGFTPFRQTDEKVIRFAKKINRAMTDMHNLKTLK